MKVALGLKAHSGWAVLVVLGDAGNELRIIERRRIELIEEGATWAKQPYHAAENLDAKEARDLVKRGTLAARRIARREIRLAAKRLRKMGHDIAACAVLVGNAMPSWTTDQILAVHFRMHQAEGVLFADALARAAVECELNLVAVPEKLLNEQAAVGLARPLPEAIKEVATLGKIIGPPWGKDQKNATLAAMIALQGKTNKPPERATV